jgi:hypothetical protein
MNESPDVQDIIMRSLQKKKSTTDDFHLYTASSVTDKLYYLDMIVYSLKVEYVQHFRHLEINRLKFWRFALDSNLYVHHATY